MQRYSVPIEERFNRSLLEYALSCEFDASSSEEFILDHSIIVPLHFISPEMQIPVAPIFVKGLATPLPLARRARALGQMVGDFIRAWPHAERVAVLCSGSFSLDIGGPGMDHIDFEWVNEVAALLRSGDGEGLTRAATGERMARAGNTGGELLNWIAMLGAIGDHEPTFLETRHGDCFAAWPL
jgi:protocatechuate 4,5-dioxygenase beta chain